ncbi:beta-lactamase, partial [Cooperia oncophora]
LFRQNFRDGWEPGGASFAVFVKGEKVVDIWGGYADKQAVRTWKEDTITITFSITKAVSALCIAVLADRGRLNYDDPVAKHWPGFAKNGKENITIEWVLSHMAGLPYLDAMITQEMALDHNIMREVLENEAPKLPPGQNTTYHAYTLGWLLDQIVRHIDEKHRGVGQFLREEITKPHGVDYHIGLKPF